MTEKLLNPGFESGLTNWTKGGTGTATVDTSVFRAAGGGVQSIRLEGDVSLYQEITPQAGKAYRVTCWVKMQSVESSPYAYGPAKVETLIQVANVHTHYVSGIAGIGIRTADWQKLELGTYAFVDGDTSAKIIIYLTAASPPDDSILWVDDFSVDEVTLLDWNRPTTLFNKDAVFNLWAENQQADVYKTDTVPAGSVPGSPKVQLEALRGEHPAFQMALQPLDAEWATVTWEWAAFSGPASFPAANMTMLRQAYVSTDAAPDPNYNLWRRYGDIPDPLVAETSSTVAINDCSPFRFTIYVPPGTPAGAYTTDLLLKKAGTLTATVPVELTVKAGSLPATLGFHHFGDLKWDMIALFETVDLNCRKAYLSSTFHHRVQDFCSGSGPIFGHSSGNFTIDTTTNNSDEIWAYMKTLGMDKWPPRMDCAPYVGTSNPTVNPPYYGQYTLGDFTCSKFTDATFTRFHPDFVAAMTTMLGLLETRMEAQSLYNGFVQRFNDEAGLVNPVTVQYNGIIPWIYRSINQKIMVNTATNPIPNYYNSYNIMFMVDYEAGFWGQETADAKRVSAMGLYPNGFGVHNMTSAIKYRLYLWALYLEGYRGCFWPDAINWAVDYNPWTGVNGGFLYPPRGEPYETIGPVVSTRWAALGKGTEDVEMFCWLQRLIDSKRNLASAPDLTTAQAALNRVGEMVSHVPQCSTYYADTSGEQFCNFDMALMEDIMSDIRSAIVLLEGYTTVHPQINTVGRVGSVSGVIYPIVYGVEH